MPKTYDRPGSAYDRDSDAGHDGPAAGKKSDPRSDYSPQTSPKHDDSDPRGEINQAERNPESVDGASSKAVSPRSIRDGEEAGAARAGGAGSSDNDEGGYYNAGGDKQGRFGRTRSRVRNSRWRLGKLASNKWMAGGALGGLGLVGLIILILILVAGAYKVVDFAEHVAAYNFARVTRQMSDSTDAITAEKMGIDVADQGTFSAIKAKYYDTATGNVKDLWSKLDQYRPQKIIDNFQRDDILTFNYRSGALGRQILDSVNIGGEEVGITRGTVKNLIPGYKFAKDVQFSRDFAPAFNNATAVNDIGPITRARVASQIRSELDVGLVAWATGRFLGKTGPAADLELERESTAAAEGKQLTLFDEPNPPPDTVTGSKSSGINDAATDVQNQFNDSLADDKEGAAIVDNPNQTPVEAAAALAKDASSVAANGLQGALGSFINSILGIINPVYKYAVPLCLIYDGSIQQSGPSMDTQSDQLERSANWVQSASAQQKDGYTATAEAAGATDWKLGDITQSNAELRASGQPVDTSTTLSTEASPTGQYTYSIADYLGPLGSVVDSIGPICPQLTNLWVGVGLGAANIAAAVATLPFGGGVSTTEAGGDAAIEAELGEQLSLFDASESDTAAASSNSFLSRQIDRAKASGSFAKEFAKDTTKQVVTIGALTLLARQLVAAEMGGSHSPVSTGQSYDNGVDDGTNILANETEQRQFYGAPMADSSLTQDNKANTASLALKENHENVYNRYLAASNPNSLLSRAAIMASGYLGRSFFASIFKVGAAFFNPVRSLSSALSPLINQTAFASTPVTSQNTYYGNVQFGYTPQEEALIHNKNLTYGDLLANQATLDQSGKEDEINTKYNDCFTKSIGDLLSSGDIQRNQNGNVIANKGLCSPDNLGPNNPKYGDLVFRWRLTHNYNNTLDQLSQEQTVTSSDDAGSPPTTGDSGYTNPFPDGWVPGRLDMGYDGTFTKQIVSPCDGKMVSVNSDGGGYGYNGGWEGAFFTVQCTQSIPGLPSSDFYFAEGVKPTVSQDQSVTAGQQIGVPGHTGHSEGPGGIEWGLADPNDPGNALAVRSQAGCTANGAYKSVVLNFEQWVVQNLNVAGYDKSLTDNQPGCA